MLLCPFFKESSDFGDLLLIILSKVHGMPHIFGATLFKEEPNTICMEDFYKLIHFLLTVQRIIIMHKARVKESGDSRELIVMCERWCHLIQKQ